MAVEKEKLIESLRCPSCAAGLAFGDAEQELICTNCKLSFPIINGIPRLMVSPFREALLGNGSATGTDALQVETALSFGYEWQQFPEMYDQWEKIFLDYMQPHPADFLRGKKVLDAGCGSGRFAYWAAKFGAEVWAADLGPAVEVAHRNTQSAGKVQVVQSDLHRLPFALESFDFIYSLGVLHHLPDPEKAFQDLLRYLKPGGDVQIYLYWKPERQPIKWLLLKAVDAARRVTTRLPHSAVYSLAYPWAAAAFLFFVWPYRIMKKVPALQGVAESIPLKQYASFPFRVCVNDQLDRLSAPIENRYTRADVEDWFKRAKLETPQINPNFGWVATGRKNASENSPRPIDQVSTPPKLTKGPMRVLALVPGIYDTSPGQRYRLEQWEPLLRERGVEITYEPFESSELHEIVYKHGQLGNKLKLVAGAVSRRTGLLSKIKNYDVVYIFREAALLGPPVFERLISQTRVPMVFDFDDAIFLSYKSPSNGYLSYLKFAGKTKTICRLAAHVMVGNPYLADYARQVNQNVTIIPTTIDTAKYKGLTNKDSRDKILIGWTGSHSTVQHLDTLRGALQKLAKLEPVRLRVIGTSSYQLEGVDVEVRKWRSETEVEDLEDIDIGIMPLPDDSWSKGKCGAKALQFMGMSIPTVCSPVGVNTDIIQDGQNGLIANSEDEWIEKLSLLIRSKSLREQLGNAGRKTVEQRYSALSQAPRVYEILKSVVENSKGRK